MTTNLRIVVVDDHGIVRSGLEALLSAQEDLEVVGTASGGDEGWQRIQELTPDVAVVDIEMTNGDGLELARRVSESSMQTRVLMLTMHDDPAYFQAATEAGASGYVLKHAVGKELVTAVRTVGVGRSYVNLAFTSGRLSGLVERPNAAAASPLDGLSRRERTVFELLVRGYGNREIGEQLNLSEKTVGSYRTRLSDKLGCRKRSELVALALEWGILQNRQDSSAT